MSTEDIKSLARRYVDQVLNQGNFNALDDLASPNYKRYLSATAAPLTLEAQKQRLAGLHAVFPDLHVTVESMFAEGDQVGVRGTVRGTQRGPFQGIAPTGISVTVFAFEVVRFENGKMIEHWGGLDTLNLLQQLGAVVSAGPEKK